MIKYICTKDTIINNVFGGTVEINIKEGETIEVLATSWGTYWIYYKGTIIDYTTYIHKNFITLAEWREQQLNSILK